MRVGMQLAWRGVVAWSCVAAIPGVATAQEPAPSGIDPAHFRERRAELMRRVGDGVILLRGAPKNGDNGTFYQDHEFWYLTGVDEPDAAVLLFPKTGRDVLLVPPFNRFTASWDGERLVPGEAAAAKTGFGEVGNVRRLRAMLDEALASDADGARPVLHTLLTPSPNRTGTSSSTNAAARAQKSDPFDGRGSRADALGERLAETFPGVRIDDVTATIRAMRGIKTAAEIDQVRAATDAACHGIAEAMKSVQPGMYEYQVAAVARYVFSRLGAGADAYAAIVGGGPNGCIMHYDANERRLEDGDLIVMDYGPTMHGYATDVTRTFPANGTFSPEQRQLVLDVHGIQRHLIEMVRPGARLAAITAECGRLLRAKGYGVDHGPCHHVGLAVHDVGGDQLAPGMIITVEPGAYLRDKAMGCRIEDIVLVTEDGCEVLSRNLPSHPDDVERLMREPGIAQRPVGLTSRDS